GEGCERRTSCLGKWNAPRWRSVRPLPTRGTAAEPAGALQRLQRLAQALVLDRQGLAELGACQRHARGQELEHALLEAAALPVLELGDDLQVGRLRIGRDQGQMDRR